MIVHNAIGGKEVIHEIQRDGDHNSQTESELCAGGDISAYLRSLVSEEDRTLKSLHVLNCGVLGATVNLVQSVHSFC